MPARHFLAGVVLRYILAWVHCSLLNSLTGKGPLLAFLSVLSLISSISWHELRTTYCWCCHHCFCILLLIHHCYYLLRTATTHHSARLIKEQQMLHVVQDAISKAMTLAPFGCNPCAVGVSSMGAQAELPHCFQYVWQRKTTPRTRGRL